MMYIGAEKYHNHGTHEAAKREDVRIDPPNYWLVGWHEEYARFLWPEDIHAVIQHSADKADYDDHNKSRSGISCYS